MPRCIVKQPNDRYAIWSSVVDDFVLVDARAEEAIVEELNSPMNANFTGGKDALRAAICREFENLASDGRAWKWGPTWNEAIETIRELHGEEVAVQRELDALS
jgi:hypothetical protein